MTISDIIYNLGAMPNWKTRVTKKVAKELLMQGFYLINGRGFSIVAKHVGLGVYELSSVDFQ
jgi:hypothetical protein